jgi:hypothetical protein
MCIFYTFVCTSKLKCAILLLRVNYKVRDGNPRTDCSAEWMGHRKIWRTFWTLLAGFFPINLAVEWVYFRLFPESNFNFPFAAGVAYLAAIVVVANLTSFFRCPRCGFRFYASGPFGLGHNPGRRNCGNCGLQKWQCSDSQAEEATHVPADHSTNH